MNNLQSTAMVALAFLVRAASAGHGPDAGTPASRDSVATPYQAIEAMLSEAARFPAAGDDFTLYISGRYAR
jgi:hypothetical protein